MPSNEAFSAAPNGTIPPAQLLANHVVPDFVGYLPDLKDGAVLKTRTGATLAISVRDGQYFVNGARITTANLILANGVAHVIDKVGDVNCLSALLSLRIGGCGFVLG